MGLRLRILLFFALLGLGAVAIVLGALMLGYSRADNPALLTGFVNVGLLSGFGILGLAAMIWLLFDEKIAKPVEALAASLRARAYGDLSGEIDHTPAAFLGDLAPAAAAVSSRLGDANIRAAAMIAEQTARLEAEKRQLAAILSGIPVAVIMVGGDDGITLYDGHAAGVLDDIHPLGLGRSVYDYFDATSLRSALDMLHANPARKSYAQQLVCIDGSRLFDATLHRMGETDGYMLSFAITEDHEAERPVVFDFDLNARRLTGDVLTTRLRDLTYVVFDTETTGLLADRDEVVQIGAVRVVAGRAAKGEKIDTLVNPGRAIPPSSTRVHGISDAMVQGAPDMAHAAHRFHRFAKGAVLVAHNAPFDMAFFKRAERDIGASFDHPVLDTVLLSAVLFGGSAEHTLDALAERLEVTIDAAHRHTAMGDALATRDVFLKMLPLLESRGLHTFGDVLREARRHGRLVPDLNHHAISTD